jgi:hypothetical protein
MNEEKYKPTIGRIVYYRMSEDIIFPAIVTKVNEDETIELQVFGTKHNPNRYNVSQGSGVMMWDWMPFQKDQQKRVEAMADKIVEEKIQN